MKKSLAYCRFVWLTTTVNLLLTTNSFAADSYRYFHVSIDTPWAIFIFLLLIILFPFVLSAILYWYFTFKKHKAENESQASKELATDGQGSSEE